MKVLLPHPAINERAFYAEAKRNRKLASRNGRYRTGSGSDRIQALTHVIRIFLQAKFVDCTGECSIRSLPLCNYSALLLTLGIAVRHDQRESLLIFSRSDERANHRMLFRKVSQRTAIHLAEPEKKARNVRVAAQIS